ncbi:MAG: hypothetical protein ABIL58_05725 [Pseudomonadota bacterium]
MRALLAERLLAQVMGWEPDDVARERPILQALADLKYDGYQQFSPGMRFLESLALWLAQFQEAKERQIAYDFVKSRLVFFSHEEMAHFSAVVFPDFIRPLLIDHAVTATGKRRYQIGAIVGTDAFKSLQASSLFLGLSDGARIDMFRRSNRDLSHEQIFQSYDLPRQKLEELAERFKPINGQPAIRALVLLDDFTASGASYFRQENGAYTGKIAKFLARIRDDDSWKILVRLPDTLIIVALYVATNTALQRMRDSAAACLGEAASSFVVTAVQHLDDDLCVTRSDEFAVLAEKYYDESLEDEHTRKGRTDLKFGFAGGGLPVVLHHNSPNNSLFLLWAEERSSVRALFPRISRHKGDA